MKNILVLVTILISVSSVSMSQTMSVPKTAPTGKAAATVEPGPSELAAAAVLAHGGSKFTAMKSFVVRGSMDVTVSAQTIPASFAIIISGDRYVFELNNPFQPIKQVYDGNSTYSTGYELPPITSLGFPLLAKVGQTGYVISAPASAKKKRGFRITTPDGFYTDFFINEKTGQIKSYESSYDVNGRLVTTSVEIDELQVVEGITVPTKYSQRFDLGQVTAYADFKTKELTINTPLPDSTFALPK
jgi:hypothetical protein